MARKQTMDTALLFGIVGMLLLGITMVSSATLFMADKDYHDSLFFIKRHASHLVFGLGGFFLGFCVKPRALVGLRVVFLVATLCLLTLVYLPGVGVMVNGARRWVALPFMSLQPSELAKWSFIVYVAAYCAKRSKQEDRLRLVDAVAIFSLTFICDVLLCMQPDFGSAIVLTVMVFHITYVAGLPYIVLAVGFGTVSLLSAFLVFYAPYRLTRVLTFLNPWAYAFGSGYQLTQSLMAIGRGGIWGVGIGSGLQKIFYLPEAHTDFIFAIVCEELGFVGGISVLFAYLFIVLRIYQWGYRFAQKGEFFYAYYAMGVGSWFAIQVGIAAGVNMGMLPTKGLAMPLLSYGGSHLVSMLLALGVLFSMIATTSMKDKGALFTHGVRC